MQTLDYLVFFLYFILVSGIGYSIYRKSAKGSAADFFLAEGALTWWAIGSSLIASNISAEQFIGMSGSGFALGLAISAYEWMAAATLLIVAVFFLPIYLKNKIYTMPQFLAQRYDKGVSTVMAVFWLLVYVFVNLTSILYLGALCLEAILGIHFYYCVLGLAIFAILITLGGMKVIGYTDVIQVVVLILGGLATTYLALDLVSENIGDKSGWLNGLMMLKVKAPEHFNMIIHKGEMMIPDGAGGTKDAYLNLPGLSVLVGAMWIMNLSYWGCNQYITQRALGAESLETARNGLLFAGFLKLIMPILVVIPGIAAYVLFKGEIAGFAEKMMESGVVKPDRAYPSLLELLPAGLKGLSFAALTAAIVASLAGKANSISTIFTLDIYKHYIRPNASQEHLVKAGRISVLVAFLIAILVAPSLKNLDQGFQYIQEYTGFITPGVLAIFLLGFFWKKTNTAAAWAAALTTIPLSAILKFWLPDLPFMNRMEIVFVFLILLMVGISLGVKSTSKPIDIQTEDFRTSKIFSIFGVLICGIIAALYILFW